LGRHDSRDLPALEDELSSVTKIGDGDGRFEIGDSGRRRFLLGVVFFFVRLIVDLGKEFGSDAGTAFQGANLRMIYRSAEGVLAGRWRRGRQSVGYGIRARLSREVDGDGGAGGRVLGMIGPGIRCGLVSDIGGFERDWRVTGAIQTLRSLQAKAEAPIGIITKGKEEDGIVRGLRRRGSHGWLLGWWGRLRLRPGGYWKRKESQDSGKRTSL
jgi:hypothetical protein